MKVTLNNAQNISASKGGGKTGGTGKVHRGTDLRSGKGKK